MLGKFIKINNMQLPNPVEYSESFAKVSNTFQSEAGDDLVVDVRVGKYTGNFTFQVSSFWKDKLKAYADMPTVQLSINGNVRTVRMETFDCSLENHSVYSENTKGYWTVTFAAVEL
ncbi:MAG: hypothetical protein NC225_12340 [Clostridium sp.]|nr:hypothetical protein [Clostridium sp.]MCM1400258.1 hypothetical protein [Clostridium sp.]MCM1460971.1 hypothetical protein [Bacteroides sp.]